MTVEAGLSANRGPRIASDAIVIALADTSRDFVALAATDGQVLFVNRAGRRTVGLADPPSLAPRALADYVWPEDLALASRVVADVAGDGARRESQIRFKHHQTNALIPMACQLFLLKGQRADEPDAVAIVARGVDAASDERRAIVDEAAGLTRLTEMFAGIVGHDLRNPLNAILTCAHLVIHQSKDADAKAALGRIISSGHRMQRMIDQLLDLTRIRVGSGIPLHVESVDLAAIAQQVVQEVGAAHPEWRIEYTTSGNTQGAWDQDRVAQMVSNLVGNAVQHGVRDAGIGVAIDGTRPDDVTIEVHNAGAIPVELLPILFNPFRVVHQKRHKSGGLGLGLFVTRQIALAHGGDVTATSSPETGTAFVVRLPREHAGAQPLASLSGLGEEDMAVLEMLATAPRATSVTAQLFGAVALHERVPQEYWKIFERYEQLLDLALDHQTYKTDSPRLSDELRAIAEQLGILGAGAREVAELHARALKQRTRGVTVAKAQALTAEGRLISFELMGHLLSYYRRRSGLVGGDG